MFKKTNKPIVNPTLPSSQIRTVIPKLAPSSGRSLTKGPSITKQFLAKFENKYTSKVKTAGSTDSDISDSEPSLEKETIVDVKEEFNKRTKENADEEAIYESDFETSDSDVPENEKSSASSETQLKDKNTILPTDTDEISEESIHENIMTFEELMKLNRNQVEAPAINLIDSDHDEISEHLESEIEEISTSTSASTIHNVKLPEPNLSRHLNQETKSISQLNDNIITFSELLSRNDNALTASGNQVIKENILKDAEPIKKLMTESTIKTKEDSLNQLEQSVKEECSAKQPTSDKVVEQEPNKITSSPSKPNNTSTNPIENLPRVTERSSKSKSKRKSNRKSLEERRRLERMFFLLEKQSQQGAVEQPVFKPLAMSWEREAENTEGHFDSENATPEDAFAEMLRLRLRLTRDKMAAEYAAYRSCCTATQILASSHQPVTLAATRQIISQLKQPDRLEKDS